MIKSLLTSDEVLDYVNSHSLLLIQFFASWSVGCSRIRPHFTILANRYNEYNMHFASADIDYIGIDNLNALKIKLNLGAIPAFYLFRDGILINTLISSSEMRLEEFIRGSLSDKDNLNKNLVKPGSNVLNYTRVKSARHDQRKSSIKRSVSCNVKHRYKYSC